MANEIDKRPTKNERREQAREQARVAREAEKQREKRNKLWLQGGIVLGIVAVLAVVGLVLMQTMKPAGPGPLNMISGGATFTKDLKVVNTPALQGGEERQAPATDRSKMPIDVTIYVDYLCPYCGLFDQTNAQVLENFVGSGDVNLTVYPINFLDVSSMGTKYSTRAANLFACVVEQQPDFAFKLHNRLLSKEVQPAEGSTGLTDEQLLEQANLAGATVNDELKQCVNDRRFGPFISANYKAASETGIWGLADGAQLAKSQDQAGNIVLQDKGGPQKLIGTPLVIVNGQEWRSASRNYDDFESYLLKLKSQLEGTAQQNGAATPAPGTTTPAP